MTIAVSSCCIKKNKLEGVLRSALDNGIQTLELSGGMERIDISEVERLIREYQSLGLQIFIHNYFPPPDRAFVLNIAHPSSATISNQHIRRTIDLCARLGVREYSVHAGLAFSPNTGDLGREQAHLVSIDLEKSRREALAGYERIADYAQERDVMLLLENNVVARTNAPDGTNDRYHFADPAESAEFQKVFEHPNIYPLIDFAHLKVSAHTLGYDPERFLEPLREKIRAVHLSDNDGTADQNLPMREDSWFWRHVPWSQIRYASIEVYNEDVDFIRSQVELAERQRRIACAGENTTPPAG